MKKIILCVTLCGVLILFASSSAWANLMNQCYGGDRVVYDATNNTYWYPYLTDFTNMTRAEQEAKIESMDYAGSKDWQMATWEQTSDLKTSLSEMATTEVRPTEFAVFPEPSYENRTVSSPNLAWEVNSAEFFTITGSFDMGTIGMEGVFADVFNGRTADDAWGWRSDELFQPAVWALGDADDHWVSLPLMDGMETMIFNFDQHYLPDDEVTNRIGMGAVGAWVVTPNVATVPEPATILLLGSGLVGLAGFGRKRFKK